MIVGELREHARRTSKSARCGLLRHRDQAAHRAGGSAQWRPRQVAHLEGQESQRAQSSQWCGIFPAPTASPSLHKQCSCSLLTTRPYLSLDWYRHQHASIAKCMPSRALFGSCHQQTHITVHVEVEFLSCTARLKRACPITSLSWRVGVCSTIFLSWWRGDWVMQGSRWRGS